MTTHSDEYLSARLPALDLAHLAVSRFAAAADGLRAAVGLPVSPYRPAPDRIAASFSGDRMFRRDGQPVEGFAELSGFFATADGWVRTHANYPHHRARLLTALALPDDTTRASFARRVAELSATDIEDTAAAAGAIAVRVRSEREWASSEPGIASAAGDMVGVRVRRDHGPAAPTATPSAPLSGVRVLDLTRVIAGPVASRSLALLGADVLRIDPPQLPEIEWQHLENGQGKRSALLDLRNPQGLATFRDLVSGADVLLTGYRPGAIEALVGDLSEVRPGLVRGRVCAWGHAGPWAGRRGFDSIVQAASGIALIEGDGRPGPLPAQVLDHASGYLLAAGVLDALTGRLADGAGRDIDVSLARTASSLLDAPGRREAARAAQLPGPDTVVSHGGITTARPVLAGFDDYPFPARTWGADEPRW